MPIWVDLGARFSRNYFLGLNAAYGFATLADELVAACNADSAGGAFEPHCNGHTLRLGLELLYHPTLKGRVSPWFGGGIGWEWLNVREVVVGQGQSVRADVGLNGPQLFMGQGGVDVMVTPAIGLGLFVAFTLDMYVSDSIACTGSCAGVEGVSNDIPNKTTHTWFVGGARVTFLP